MSEWISVKDRRPKPLEKVLVYYKSGSMEIDWLFYDGTFIYGNCYGEATHWTPLPAPPEEET